jgi:hypothetical protein
METKDPKLDPAQVAAVATLQAARSAGYIDLPGIGRAKIVASHATCKETFPPQRTTTLSLEVEHSA